MTAEPVVARARALDPQGAGAPVPLGEGRRADRPAPRGTILFVHGSSMGSQPTFDLQVPGRPDSSAMDHFARLGYDTWCVDMEGYGRSDKHRDINSDIATGADDLAAATDYIARTRGVSAYLTYGISSGALRAALFAQRHPERVRRLALDAFVWTGRGEPDAGGAPQAPAGVPREEPPPDRPRLRAQHLHARSSGHRRRRRRSRRSRTRSSPSTTRCRPAPTWTCARTCRWSIPR